MGRACGLLLSLAWLATSAALYSPRDGVVTLDGKSFDRLVINSPGVAVVEFYAPWCGHCQRLVPQYKKVAQHLQGIALVGSVDCDNAQNRKLCSNYQITSFPTIKLFQSEKQKNPYTGAFYKDPIDYNGPRTAKPIADAVTALLTDMHITRVRKAAQLAQFTSKSPALAKVVLFTSKQEPSTLYKGLSMQLHQGLAFAEVHNSVSDVVEQYGITQFPTLIVIKADGDLVHYDGDLKAVPLREFLEQFVDAKPAAENSNSSSNSDDGSAASGKKGPAAQAANIKNMTWAAVSELDSKEDMWLLAFYLAAGDECAAELAELSKGVAEMQSVVATAAVNLAREELEQVSKLGVSVDLLRDQPCTPQLVLLPFGEDKSELEDYQVYSGAVSDGKALQRFVTEAVPAFTMELSPASYQHFMTEAGAMGSAGMPVAPKVNEEGSGFRAKVVLFTNKDEVPGIYKALAMNFRSSGMLFGWLHAADPANKPILTQLKATKVPSLVLVLPIPMQEEGPEGRKMAMSVQPYGGPLKYNAMAEWLDEAVKVIEVLSGKADAASGSATNVKPGLVPQISTQEELRDLCSSKLGICVLGLLDPPSSQAAHEQQLAVLAGAAAKLQGQPFHFLWLEGRKFRPFASAFGVLASDIPAVVALSPKKMRYAVSSGALSEQALNSFLSGVLSGKIRTNPLQELPELVAGDVPEEVGVAEDGSAAAEDVAAVEEEFDLSDILAEEVDVSLASKEERLKQVEQELQAQETAKKQQSKSSDKKKKKKKKVKKSSSGHSEL